MRIADEKLVELAQEGDEKSFGELVRTYQNAVYAIALQFIGNFADAQDITQEVFIEAYTKLYQLRAAGKFAGWLRSIAINTCRMWMRNRKNIPELDETIANCNHADATDESGLYEQLISALDILPEEQRTIIILRYIDDLSYEQIGDFLGIPVGTVRSRLHRAKEKLKRRINMIKAVLDRVKLDPDFPEEVKREISGYEEPMQNEARKLETDPGNSAAHFELGCLYVALHNTIFLRTLNSEAAIVEKAIEHLEKAMDSGGESAGAYMKMAEVYSFAGETEKVKEMLGKSRCFSDWEEWWFHSTSRIPFVGAILLMSKERYAEAEEKIKMALELTSSYDVESYTLMARANSGRGDRAQAIASLKKALELSKTNRKAQYKPDWLLPNDPVDWEPAKLTNCVINYVKERKEFDLMREDPEFQALFEA